MMEIGDLKSTHSILNFFFFKRLLRRRRWPSTFMKTFLILIEQMQQAASGVATTQSPSELAAKMKMMEAALEKMNRVRFSLGFQVSISFLLIIKEKEQEDAQTENLKKKLAAFEAKFKQMEEEKALQAQAEKADVLRDKVIMMEDKLRKMENRKSVSITMHMQQQMQKLEEELRSVRAGGMFFPFSSSFEVGHFFDIHLSFFT